MRPKHVVALTILAALWGASFLFMKVAVPSLGPIPLIEARVLLAGIILLLIALFRRQRVRILHRWRSYIVLGTLNAGVPFCLIATAEVHLSAALAAILNATTPLFTAVVARFWVKDLFSWSKFIGVILGLFGVIVLVGWNHGGNTSTPILAVLASLGAALCYALGGVYAGRAIPDASSLELASGQQLASALILIPFTLFLWPHHVPSFSVSASVVSLAVVCTAFAYLIYFFLLKSVGPVKTLSVTFLVPVFGVCWGAIFLHESIHMRMLFGLLLILISVGFVTGARFQRRRKEGVTAGRHVSE